MIKRILLIIAILAVAAVAFYVINIYEDPADIQAKMREIRMTLIQSNQDLADIEAYLSAREKEITGGQKLSDLQDKLILVSEGLITAPKDDLVSFDRQAGALRSVIQLEIEQLYIELSKYENK